jgi:hypothetical protein
LYVAVPGHKTEESTSRTEKLALERAMNFATVLMNAKYEQVNGTTGMLVLHNISKLETGKSGDIVVRNITKPFWNACINKVDETDTTKTTTTTTTV